KTTRRTGRSRVIYLTARMIDMCRGLIDRHPEGPIFRNRNGQPWTRNSMACRFKRMRDNLGFGEEATAYAVRHGFATTALERGVPIATVAELLGHTSTAMVSAHYSHLHERREHLRLAVEQATEPEKKVQLRTPNASARRNRVRSA